MTSTTKLNPPELLSQLAESNSSGCLELAGKEVSWKIYLQDGKLKYADCSIQLLEGLQYHLHHFGWTEATAALKQFPSSLIRDKSPEQSLYELVVNWLIAEKHLNLTQVAKLLEYIVKDEIQLCLRLDRSRSKSSWQNDSVPDWIPSSIQSSLALDVAECLKEQQTKLQQWQNCSEKLESVHQRPYFPPSWEQKELPPGSLNRKTLTELSKVLRGRTSIRQLSLLLKKDELQVAQILSPYIEDRIIYLHHAPEPFNRLPNIPRLPNSEANKSPREMLANTAQKPAKTWKIICIDDSPTILSEIKRFLDKDKFEVTAIDNPVQAVSKIFQIEPDLILLDITMPRINGYKLCGLLRSSGKCDDTPIIMVTGNTGIIDKARAKLSGATDYFTKPFTKEGLMQIVEKNLH